MWRIIESQVVVAKNGVRNVRRSRGFFQGFEILSPVVHPISRAIRGFQLLQPLRARFHHVSRSEVLLKCLEFQTFDLIYPAERFARWPVTCIKCYLSLIHISEPT